MQPSYGVNHYRSAKQRFLKPSLMQFFAREFPRYFGPVVREKIADELIAMFEQSCPDSTHLQHGQMIWIALDKHTRGDDPNRRFVPVILSLVTEEDVNELEDGMSSSRIAEKVIARIIVEAYDQGGILSMRDIGLISARHSSTVSAARKRYELKHDCVLPHTGTKHDMGSCITHKEMILRKIVLEKKDPTVAAKECKHSQQAVDRYLKDYYRVKTGYDNNPDPDYIHQVTGIAKHVVKQYITIIKKESDQL